MTGASAWNVLAAAEFLRLGEAKKMCVGVLVDKLTAETALGAAEAAELYRCEELEAEATAFAKEHFEAMAEGEEWLHLPLDRIRALLAADDVRVSSELVVIEALVRWAAHSPGDRTEAFGGLFVDPETVRLSQLSFGGL